MESALIQCAIAKEAQRNARIRLAINHLVHVLAAEGEPGTKRRLRTDDAVTAIEIVVAVKHVHRAALALGAATNAAEHFRHAMLGIHAARQGVTVIAVRSDDRILMLDGSRATNRHGLLTDVDVAEATDLLLLIGLHAAQFKFADQKHLLEPVQHLLGRNMGGGSRNLQVFGIAVHLGMDNRVRCCRCGSTAGSWMRETCHRGGVSTNWKQAPCDERQHGCCANRPISIEATRSSGNAETARVLSVNVVKNPSRIQPITNGPSQPPPVPPGAARVPLPDRRTRLFRPARAPDPAATEPPSPPAGQCPS